MLELIALALLVKPPVELEKNNFRFYAQSKVETYAEWVCLDELWQRESSWQTRKNPHLAVNRSSGAYGIPQSLPASKMASAGWDWKTNPRTQIDWGINYIESRYGDACTALRHHDLKNWY